MCFYHLSLSQPPVEVHCAPNLVLCGVSLRDAAHQLKRSEGVEAQAVISAQLPALLLSGICSVLIDYAEITEQAICSDIDI